MGLKYVINSMKRRKLRTFIIAMALTIGVALVGALLALVDTQRQFSLQAIGAQTGGYDLSITQSDTASSPFFEIAPVEQLARQVYPQIAQLHPRIQANAEARKAGALEGQGVTFVAIDPDQDTLVKPANPDAGGFNFNMGPRRQRLGPGMGRAGEGDTGSYPPGSGQVFLDIGIAAGLNVGVGDEITLAYVRPIARDPGKPAITGTRRIETRFIVAGIGVLSGLSNDVQNPVIMRLADAQAWLSAPDQTERMLLVWQSNSNTNSSDARLAVTAARDVGERVRDELQQKLGPDFTVTLPKYSTLEATSQGFAFAQTFITLYGLLSMGIVGLMVNALMTTTVAEQKFDLAVLRVLGSPRRRLYEAVIIEVILLGIVGLILGLILGRAINDYVMVPILLANLDLPSGVRAAWTLETALIPTGITIVVLALATISPARTAAATKVMVVLNPAAADQPTLEDLAKLRERRADTGLLLAGIVMLAFSSIVLIVLPTVFLAGNLSGQVTVIFGSLLLMVIGISLLFYFFTTPTERVLVALYNLINPKAAYFAGRYALRGKGRNALISLMVVMSGVLPCLLATQLALQDANLETDTRFQNGAPLIAQRRTFFAGTQVFRRASRTEENLQQADSEAVSGQPGVTRVVGIADGFQSSQASDRISLRASRVSLVGVQGDLNQVLFTSLFRWTEGDGTALTRITTDPDAAIISQGLAEALDLHVGDIIRVRGNGIDHERDMTIAGVAARVPGFSEYFTRNRNDAASSGIFINFDTYRDLIHDPAFGDLDPDQSLLTKLMANVDPAVDESEVVNALRDYLGNENDLQVTSTTEDVEQSREQLQQGRIFIVLLTGLSMVTAIFGVLAVMYTAVMSRRIEIGMLKAVGASKGALRGIFIGEALITTLAAGVSGIIAGTVLGYAFELSQRLQNDSPFLFAFDFNTALLIITLVCVAAIFSAALATQPVIKQKAIKILRER